MNFTNTYHHLHRAPVTVEELPRLLSKVIPCPRPLTFTPSSLLTGMALQLSSALSPFPSINTDGFLRIMMDCSHHKQGTPIINPIFTKSLLTAAGPCLCFPLQRTPREGAQYQLSPDLLLTFSLEPIHQNHSDQSLPWCCQTQRSVLHPWQQQVTYQPCPHP